MRSQVKNCNSANNSSVTATLAHETGNPKKSYSDKLKSPKWQKKRLDILNLRGFKCEVCGDEENQIQVHHRFYLKGREPWQYDNDVFQVLCEKCHENSHKKDVEIRNIEVEVLPQKYADLCNHLSMFPENEIEKLSDYLIELIDVDNINDFIEVLNQAICIGFDETFREILIDIHIENTNVKNFNIIYNLQKQVKYLIEKTGYTPPPEYDNPF